MANTILISGFSIWMKRGAARFTVEFKGNSFRTLKAVMYMAIAFPAPHIFVKKNPGNMAR